MNHTECKTYDKTRQDSNSVRYDETGPLIALCQKGCNWIEIYKPKIMVTVKPPERTRGPVISP